MADTKKRSGRRAWIHQLKKHVDEVGPDKAAWFVDWVDPEGKRHRKSCGAGKVGKATAKALADKTHSQLVTGTYNDQTRKTWDDFRARFEKLVTDSMESGTRAATLGALTHFARVMKPKAMAAITSERLDEYVSKRRQEKTSKRTGTLVSVATVNKELRHLRAAFRKAHKWGFLAKLPEFPFLKQTKRLPTFVSPEHFSAIYVACEHASDPIGIPNVSAADWWRGLLVTAFMSGWRVGQILSLRWEHVDLEAGTAFVSGEDTKGRRDERLPLHPLIVEHLAKLQGSFDSHVFPWNLHRRRLWPAFKAIQAAAKLADGSPLPKAGKPNRDGSPDFYEFHDLRRGFAALNAAGMDLFQLQSLMQHKSLETTRGYVNMANQLNTVVGNLFVPTLPERASVVG